MNRHSKGIKLKLIVAVASDRINTYMYHIKSSQVDISCFMLRRLTKIICSVTPLNWAVHPRIIRQYIVLPAVLPLGVPVPDDAVTPTPSFLLDTRPGSAATPAVLFWI